MQWDNSGVGIVQNKTDHRSRLALCGLSLQGWTSTVHFHYPGQGPSPSVTTWIMVMTEMDIEHIH